jgi:regulator of sigma E protease
MITTVLAFLVTLGVLIVIHEYGHYRVARACGVKVLRFSVGFGRVLWRRQRDAQSTEFVLSALPLGGYVRMLDEREGPVAPHELGQAFNRQSLPKRAAIVAAGPVANLLLAVVLYACAHWVGIDEPKAVLSTPTPASAAERAGLAAGDWVRAVATEDGGWRELRSMSDLRWEVTQAALDGRALTLNVSDRWGHGTRQARLDLKGFDSREVGTDMFKRIGLGPPFSEPVLSGIKPGGPAQRAGLRDGDRVLRVDGQPVFDAVALRDRIRASVRGTSAQAMQWDVDRDGQTLRIEVVPEVVREGNASFGRIQAYPGPLPQMVTVRYGAVDGIVHGVQRTWEVSKLSLKMMGRMLIGEASLKNLSGPLTIADYAGQSVQRGLADYLGFLALVSVSLGVLNLLPLPLLDGGHLMYYLFEGVTGRPVSEAWLKWLQRGGALIMLLLMTLALSNDVARLLGLH